MLSFPHVGVAILVGGFTDFTQRGIVAVFPEKSSQTRAADLLRDKGKEKVSGTFFTRQTIKYTLRLRPIATADYSAISHPRPRRQRGADHAGAGSAANARTAAIRTRNRPALWPISSVAP
jgi:hypothetical protein